MYLISVRLLLSIQYAGIDHQSYDSPEFTSQTEAKGNVYTDDVTALSLSRKSWMSFKNSSIDCTLVNSKDDKNYSII